MNFLEIVGLISLIAIGGYIFLVYSERADEEKRQRDDIDRRAIFVSYRLALRHLYRQHEDPNVRKKIEQVAEYYYGGVSTIALDLDDSEYRQLIEKDVRGDAVYQTAQSSIEKNGYLLAVENGNISNPRGAGRKILA
ncbi:hypothetical protein [Candidatus Accumulibacter sp. ACC003]|uniref:hypothetical protein n=1 Tax=Candidatus Accumulibacter sp. ACC003 TaxID=2823334 RepID=UPI0025BDA75F|nr:hypothetical protein [Candidatus Accumulibacter sp. ACC003]